MKTLTVPIENKAQLDKIEFLVKNNNGTLLASNIRLQTDKGICLVDVLGRVTWES